LDQGDRGYHSLCHPVDSGSIRGKGHMKGSSSDTERFARYQAVVDAILAKESFRKPDIYASFKPEEKTFIGRVIRELMQDRYLNQNGQKSNPSFSWTENKKDFNPGRWIDQRVFTPTIKRSPSSDRPRERLLRLGPAELKTSELLAILVRAGQQGESAMRVGEKLAARFGNDLQTLSLKARGELKQISKAIGETAYCQIIAALELGKRMAGQVESSKAKTERVSSTADALAFCKRHFARLAQEGAKEEFHVVLLDQKHQVMKTEQITVGLSNQSLAHPREVFRPAIRESASSIILVHNHPSGDPTPSQEDKTITKELKGAAEVLSVRLLDHIILGKDRILSMAEERIF
jgi:DNA repair protein RadC